MKNLYIKTLAVLLAVLLATGCIKETSPVGGTITKDQMSQSDAPLQAKLGAITASLHKANVAGYMTTYGVPTDFGLPAIHIITEHMLEDMTSTFPGSYDHFQVWGGNIAQGDSYIYCAYFWDVYYPWIFATNEVISMIDDAEAADKATLANLGQAYAYRAMFYLDLARLFEFKENDYTTAAPEIMGLTVPIVTEKTTSEEALNNPRVPREQLYKLILDDLKKAETYLEGTSFSYNTPSLAAVYGLYARTFIEMGYWEDAAWDQIGVEGLDAYTAFVKADEYATKAIETSGKTPLTQTEWEDPSKGFNSGASNNAWIWGIPVVSDNLNNVTGWATWMSSQALWSYGALNQFGASKAFYEKISDSDFRKHSWIDPDWTEYYDYKLSGTAEDQDIYVNGGYKQPYANLKFRPGNGDCVDYNTGNTVDHPLMRVEEMYFLQMEARAGQENLAGARTVLNDFMRNRILDGSYDCTSKTSSKEAFIKEMMFQKRVEFWGEGILFYDYKRLDQPITRGYEGTNHNAANLFNTTGRSPQWNIVITRGEHQANRGIVEELNNPDPSEKIPVWSE